MGAEKAWYLGRKSLKLGPKEPEKPGPKELGAERADNPAASRMGNYIILFIHIELSKQPRVDRLTPIYRI
ncbi:hypothetical protein DPMN_172376 [Dreissena polymorpha]|uniref:Uncharacterized protein n=1 Tax=Dreissena polymorpha TaxID=45954 RepID=A0A9D4E0R3_DREPO|nr:hypothetical protein DPMN_172376 [Dreissena polymorpha]